MKPPPAAQVTISPLRGSGDVAVSPDGLQVVYRVANRGGEVLALRRVDEADSTLLPGTIGAQSVAFSPDGTSLVFNANDRLQTLKLGASSPAVVCDLTGRVMGIRWSLPDTIVFARRGLYRVAASGGVPELIAEPPQDEPDVNYAFPELTPGGRAVIFTLERGGQRHIAARVTGSGEHKTLIENASLPRYVASGHLVFMQSGRVVAAPFDAERLQLVGAPVVFEEGVVEKITGSATFDVGAAGTFAGISGTPLGYRSRFIWKSRTGAVEAIGQEELAYPRYPRLSPDGRRLAATIGPSGQGQLWIFDVAGSAQPLKLTFTDHNVWPTWTPDGRTLVFTRTSTSTGADVLEARRSIMAIAADGSTLQPQPLATDIEREGFAAVSPDGRWLLYSAFTPRTGLDLFLKPLDGTGEQHPWKTEAFDETEPTFSPDGRWVAFVSTQTGDSQVWVRPFAGAGAPVRVSPDGGHEPMWSRDGRELFYQQGNRLMAASVASTSPSLHFSHPRVLFEGGFVPYDTIASPRSYDIGPDGRFLMIEEKPDQPLSIVTVVTGWRELLKSRAPARR